MRRIAGLFALSVALTLASVTVERKGPLVTIGGEGFCGEDAAAPCEVEALAGGWPLPYLVDNPQISVPNALHVVEDDFQLGAFLADVGFGFGLLLALASGLRRIRRMS